MGAHSSFQAMKKAISTQGEILIRRSQHIETLAIKMFIMDFDKGRKSVVERKLRLSRVNSNIC
jgi:hypothetical protein